MTTRPEQGLDPFHCIFNVGRGMDHIGCNDQVVRCWLKALSKGILLSIKRFEVDKIIP